MTWPDRSLLAWAAITGVAAAPLVLTLAWILAGRWLARGGTIPWHRAGRRP